MHLHTLMPGVFFTTYIKYLQRAYVHAFIHLCQECSSLPTSSIYSVLMYTPSYTYARSVPHYLHQVFTACLCTRLHTLMPGVFITTLHACTVMYCYSCVHKGNHPPLCFRSGTAPRLTEPHEPVPSLHVCSAVQARASLQQRWRSPWLS